jgi:hypothetical protein
MRLRLVFLLALLLGGCTRFPPPTRVAVHGRELPPVIPDRALVIFMFPPCARYSGPAANEEEMVLCRVDRRNRIRVVEQGARLVTDFGVDQYGASYEEPGQHLYGAFHHFDHCTWDRTDCVAALKANLLPGRVYFVTFRWKHITTSDESRGLGLDYGRLEVTPVSEGREHLFRARLAEIDRVEPIPGFREQGGIGELRSFYVSQQALVRVAQDRRDGVPIPHLGGRVTVEEITKEEEEELAKDGRQKEQRTEQPQQPE